MDFLLYENSVARKKFYSDSEKKRICSNDIIN
jgi:hypothetical protein